MIYTGEVPSLRIPRPWEYATHVEESGPTLRERLESLSKRMRDMVVPSEASLDAGVHKLAVISEKILKLSAVGAIGSSVAYVGVEAISRSGNMAEALLVLATALSIGLASREQLRESDTNSLSAWRSRDRW